MKKCKSCGVEKAEDQFSRNGKYRRNKCKECTRPQINKWYQENKDYHLENTKNWALANPDKRAGSYKKYRENNADKCRERCLSWQKRNPAKVTALVSEYRARKMRATPPWLSEEHKDQTLKIYEHARECEMLTGDKYHVDHTIPLKGENISGLHVPWNLQVLPADINIAKSNSHG
jgi:hypothetical protein